MTQILLSKSGKRIGAAASSLGYGPKKSTPGVLMRVSLSHLALACAMALSIPAFAEDGGIVAESDAGTAETDAGVGPGPGDLAPACTGTGESTCGTGNICVQGFCYATCEGACSTLLGETGACFIQAQGDTTGFCSVAGTKGDLCGGMVNRSCDPTDSVCLAPPGSPGFCSVLCTPTSPGTCATAQLQGSAACGCDSSEVCSSAQLADGDGICVDSSNIDGTCGINTTTGQLEVCTNGQTCQVAAQGDTTGNCVGDTTTDPIPSDDDAGTTGPGPSDDDAGTTGPGPSDDDAGTTGTPDDEPGRDEPEPEPTSGCSASHVPSQGVPFGLAGLAMLGVFFRRRRS